MLVPATGRGSVQANLFAEKNANFQLQYAEMASRQDALEAAARTRTGYENLIKRLLQQNESQLAAASDERVLLERLRADESKRRMEVLTAPLRMAVHKTVVMPLIRTLISLTGYHCFVWQEDQRRDANTLKTQELLAATLGMVIGSANNLIGESHSLCTSSYLIQT